jgi:hypothetical protein
MHPIHLRASRTGPPTRATERTERTIDKLRFATHRPGTTERRDAMRAPRRAGITHADRTLACG